MAKRLLLKLLGKTIVNIENSVVWLGAKDESFTVK